jgi:hypothetical protein
MIRLCFCLLVSLAFVSGCGLKKDYISGQVVNEKGPPEAGVWVIAETDSLPTDYRKIVVTDDKGRFVLPQLPNVEYEIWVRGYGLADSEKHMGSGGDDLLIQVKNAETASVAAEIYPANYWLSMLSPPSVDLLQEADYPYDSQSAWLSQFKLSCLLCHQIGNSYTRFTDRAAFDHGLKKTAGMNFISQEMNRELLVNTLGSFASDIASGKIPAEVPPRPEGIERNFVITQWGWGELYTWAHDLVSTDKRDPFLYANKPVYGGDIGNDHVLIVDPVKHEARQIKIPAGKNASRWCEQTYKPLGSEDIFTGVAAKGLGCPEPGIHTIHKPGYVNPVNPHNPMMDDTGKVWLTMQVRREWGQDLPDFCKKSPVIANNYHHRQLGYFDTLTEKIIPVDTCFGTHHLQFDNKDLLWTSGDANVVGWLDTKTFSADDPKSLESSMGWSEGKIDTDGDDIADETVVGFRYGVIPNPLDGSVWWGMPAGIHFSKPGQPGFILRYDPILDQHEAFSPPFPGNGPRGIDVDTQGIIWTALGGSGHLARFDRKLCKQTWGRGDQCPEGWKLWRTPGPQFKTERDVMGSGSNDMHYYIWVDQFDTLGMGSDTVIINGTASDSLIAFNQKTETFTVIRVPYPLTTYTRGVDGRIDDPKSGWKGRGLWFTNGQAPIFQSEIPKSYAGKIQLRPSPLAH